VVFGNVPQLKSVDLDVMFDPSQVVLPWSQLTRVSAEMTPDAAADILRQACTLAKFTCILWSNPGGNAIPVPAGVVPPLIHLESLILLHCGWEKVQKLLLDALTAPALRHLTISEYELGDKPLSTIAAFLSRSRCSLQKLHVTVANLPRAAYCAAFPSIPIIDVRKGLD
jgi:hypothetical protein